MFNKSAFINRGGTLIALLFIAYITSAQTAVLPDQHIVSKADEYMAAAAAADGFSGSILIARDGKPIVSKGYRMANVELGVPNTPQTVFRWGSPQNSSLRSPY